MPLYTFEHPETGETIDLIMGMDEVHRYIDHNGLEWDRIWYKPNAAVDNSSSLDPFSQDAFRNKTANMKGSYGDALDYSRELSEKRAEKAGGEDPVKRKFFDDYKKQTGKKHLKDYSKVIEKKGVKVEL